MARKIKAAVSHLESLFDGHEPHETTLAPFNIPVSVKVYSGEWCRSGAGVMTVTEAAATLGLRPGTVRRHIAKGLIAAVKAGRDWSIERSEVGRFQRERRKAGRPKQ